ncbi:MAG: HAD family hydrolase [Ruminococcaceae bacterium]|nr:HAD family hydrolase [Oscillospiraceae bacterium]
MNKNIKLLMFDLDGTIADTLPSIQEAVNLTLERFGKPTRSYDEICEAIGNGALVLIRKSFSSDDPEELVNEGLKYYDNIYGQTYTHIDGCYEGMSEAMHTLKERGYTLAILSNKQDRYVKKISEILFSDGIISISMGQTDLPKKPDPTVPLMIAKELGFDASETAFIGDSDVDILTGKNAGMLSVGCAWGYRGRAVLEETGADIVIDHPSELEKIFK